MSSRESSRLSAYLEKSVSEQTAYGYKSGWDKWITYLGTLPAENHPGIYLERIVDSARKQQRLVFFYDYLYSTQGLRAEQLIRTSTCLRYFIGREGRDVSFFDGEIACRGRSAAGRSVAEKVECRVQMEERRIP